MKIDRNVLKSDQATGRDSSNDTGESEGAADRTSPKWPLALPPLSSQPMVSVIISNFNGERFVAAAVDSVLSQTYPHFEVVICDDGSTDGSAGELNRLSSSDSRVRVYFKENGGQASAWNLAMRHATGDIVCFLDPDDLFYPDKLAEVVAAFTRHPNAGACFNRLQPLDGKVKPSPPTPRVLDEVWPTNTTIERGIWGDWPPTSGISLRRPVVNELFPIPECFKRGYGDSYIAGLAQFVTGIVGVGRALGAYVLHGENTVFSRRPDIERVELITSHHELVVDAWRSFLAPRVGTEFAASVCNLHSRRWYWDNILALYLLRGKPRDGVHGHTIPVILTYSGGAVRRTVLWLLTSLPTPIVIWLLNQWWGTHWWKYAIRRVLWRDQNLPRWLSSLTSRHRSGTRQSDG